MQFLTLFTDSYELENKYYSLLSYKKKNHFHFLSGHTYQKPYLAKFDAREKIGIKIR